jgi:4-hydroxythreonine-4-phosphate dehydrogenase
LKNRAIKIGITLGDPAGIGPEVAFKAVNNLTRINYIPVMIGRIDIIKKYYKKLLNNFIIIKKDQPFPSRLNLKEKYFFDISSDMPVPSPGNGNVETGLESRVYIDEAINLWKRKFINAVVTGPVSKSLVEKSGVKFTGHTEYIAESIKEKNPYMLMYSKNYRVLLVTTHIPVADIRKNISAEKIYQTIMTGNNFLNSINTGKNSIAIAGLDPHCGDDGAIGSFDKKVTENAVELAKEQGLNVYGPFSADALFTPRMWNSYDLAIAHYHDQGLIPFKALAFDSGVNVTLGLSIIRTSPDHGTAFDIAGKGKASHSSMIEAIRMAYLLAKKSVA